MPVPDAEDEELIPPLRHPMFAGDNLFRDPGRRLTRTWYLFFQQLARRVRKNAAGGGGGAGGPYVRTLVLKDTAIGNDIADHVPAYVAGTATRVIGVLRKAITSELKVRIKKNGAAFITLTIPAATAVDTPVEAASFAGGGTIGDLDVFSWDITASDASTDAEGVATVTLEWS